MAFIKIQSFFSGGLTTKVCASGAEEKLAELFGWCLRPAGLLAGDGDGSSGAGAAGEGRGGEGNHGDTAPKELGNNMGSCP